ncbi:MAG: glucosamine-6-phosphate deaminase, partial [Planctomycetota bacterium]
MSLTAEATTQSFEAEISPTPPSDLERVPVTVYQTSGAASKAVAAEIAKLIRTKADAGQQAVLGLATGSTPTGVYDELIRLHQDDGLSFRNVVTFNLDEYYPMQPDELQSYVRFMNEHLFDHVDIDRANVHIPDGTLPIEAVREFCKSYERKIAEAGGLDFQILGIGRTGHVGFNEPGSSKESKTRMITLDTLTRMDAASDFFGEWNVPRKAITMGVSTILGAKRVVLMGFGEHKAPVVRKAVEGEVDAQIAASFLQDHPNARFVLDPAAASELTRFKQPWLAGPLVDAGKTWDAEMTRKAAIWLAFTLDKPLLKLTDEDYNENGLQELIASRGQAYDINIEVFKDRQRTITGWPGGKEPGKPDYSGVIRKSDVFPKRVLVFSPHPDDDVISMGGTFIRLCDQDHDVHVAYQTSGNIAVFDAAAVRHVDFLAEVAETFGLDVAAAQTAKRDIEHFVENKQAGDVDSPQLQQIKGMIRRTEARAAARFSGVKSDNIHFLDLPFYETGRVRKKPLSEDDIQLTVELLRKVKPHQVYAAGDLSDPHGTHRTCLAAILRALKHCENDDWFPQCEVWLYRGAWQEWDVQDIEMAVPLSPDEVKRKRMA